MIDLKEYRIIPIPTQRPSEWLAFMVFVESYFKTIGVAKPVVVEIGIHTGNQQKYYRQFLDAEYIGIDIADKYAKPDIIGDSNQEATRDLLKERLSGRAIDLLFIDGDHTYAAARRDYELYAPLTVHIVALHDIYSHRAIRNAWDEIVAMGTGAEHARDLFLEIGGYDVCKYRFGIGVQVRDMWK